MGLSALFSDCLFHVESLPASFLPYIFYVFHMPTEKLNLIIIQVVYVICVSLFHEVELPSPPSPRIKIDDKFTGLGVGSCDPDRGLEVEVMPPGFRLWRCAMWGCTVLSTFKACKQMCTNVYIYINTLCI